MDMYSITPEEKAKFDKLLKAEEKQKEYQKVQAAKIQLQAKWARENGCPITSMDARKHLGLPESQAE